MASNGKVQGPTNLIAVLLITRSRPGPKLIFHYPTWPDYAPLSQSRQAVDSESESEDENDRLFNKTSKSGTSLQQIPNHARLGPPIAEAAATDRLFGHSIEALEKSLSPGRWSDRKKFEICLDGLTFVGQPVYSLESGSWSEIPLGGTRIPSHPRLDDEHLDNATIIPVVTPEKLLHDFTHVPESLDSQINLSLGTSNDSNSTMSAAVIEQMAMFHVVFVLRATDRNDDCTLVTKVYNDIAKKLSKALHYCQKQSNYVALESQKLLSIVMKSKQRRMSPQEMETELVENSELAWALKELYDRISKNEVATIRLGGIETSLYVTQPSKSREGRLGPLSALLLLESKESLLRTLSHPDASPLAHFIREHTPTKNLHKHSTNLSMPLSDILYLSHHLLKWRKARLISPLHQRNTYIVHPNLNPSSLPQLFDSYARTFPTLPSLPNMLKVLSGRPIKYGLLIPSRDHRGPYMEILSFLVRHDLVIQLKTFGWLLIPSDLPRVPSPLPDPHDLSPLPRSNSPFTPVSTPSRKPTGTSPNLLSPHLRPSNSRFTGMLDDDTLSVSSDRTAVPITASDPSALFSGASLALSNSKNKKRLSTGTQITAIRGDDLEIEVEGEEIQVASPEHVESDDETDAEVNKTHRLLLNPSKPSHSERIKTGIMKSRMIEDAELRENFEALLPFMDGAQAFEEVAAKLQVKRAKVEEWFGEMERKGWVLIVRHV